MTVYTELPDSGELTHEYRAIRFSVDGDDGKWIWIGTNGSFAVTAGDTTPIEADGLVVPAFGTIDFTVTLDTTSLESTFARSDPESVEINSSAWGWTLKPLHDDGAHGGAAASDDVHTMRFSLDQGRLEGLLELDDEVLFVIVLDGLEYREGDALDGGVTALTDWETPGEFVEESVEPSTGNLRLVVGDEAPG